MKHCFAISAYKESPYLEECIRSVTGQQVPTKVIICTAAMKLFEEGKFLLNDPIYEYFPEWKNTNKVVYAPNGNFTIKPLENPILVKHVFNMAMGIGYGGNDETHRVMAEVRKGLREKYGKYYTLRQDIEAMSAVPVAFEPGTHWLYGFGHELVAGLIEVCSGMKVSEASFNWSFSNDARRFS